MKNLKIDRNIILLVTVAIISAMAFGCSSAPKKPYVPEFPIMEITEEELPKVIEELPKVTVTGQGTDGDPVNLMFIAEQEELIATFENKGWHIADKLSFFTALKAIYAGITNIPYHTAPVSSLYLFDRRADFAFQKPLSVRHRHHIRLWMSPYMIDDKNIWLGAAVHDIGLKIRFSFRNPLMHDIEPNLDLERDFILKEMSNPHVREHWKVPGIYPREEGVNGIGDKYYTDGYAVIIKLEEMAGHAEEAK